jgi:hypothetical protein
MRVLVDAAVFTEPAAPELSNWWRRVLPHVVTNLAGHEVVVLDRGSTVAWPALEVPRLCAPAVDRGSPEIEDRRLAALCREIGADLFLSTYRTSAGATVRSLVVFPVSSQYRWNLGDRRALQMAQGFVIFDPILERRLAKLGIGLDEVVHPADRGSSDLGDDRAAALQGKLIAKTVHQLLSMGSSPTRETRRQKAEASVKSTAQAALRRSQDRMVRTYAANQPHSWARRQVHRALRAAGQPSVIFHRLFVATSSWRKATR